MKLLGYNDCVGGTFNLSFFASVEVIVIYVLLKTRRYGKLML